MYSLIIVEDEMVVRNGLKSLIDYEKFNISNVMEAEDGCEAWRIMQDTHIDILLTDINMPCMDGIELSKMVRDKYPDTHIVFLTGYDEFDYALSAIKIGADDYLLKPFSKKDIEGILEKIVRTLNDKKKNREIHSLISEKDSPNLAKCIQERISDKDFSLKVLASELGFSPNYLSKLIKDELGETFQNYLISERIKKAKLLLLTTDLKNYEIADQVGFDDMNYFAHRFKIEVGTTPRKFKKEHGR